MNGNTWRFASRIVLAVVLFALVATTVESKEPALPRDFRSWTHVKSMVVTDPDHGMYGFHNVYANKAAAKVLRAGAEKPKYDEGAQFVVSIYEVETKNGMVGAGLKRRDVVKTKDRTATDTGGWRFAAFDPAGRPLAIDPVGDCFGCHARAKDTDLVFSEFAR